MNSEPTLDIIIVNWNSGNQLRDCLESITSTDLSGFSLQRVVIVDNGSSDGSASSLDYLDLPIVLISNQSNRGFSAACNQGAKGSEADLLLFLNPDTTLYFESLSAPVKFMNKSEHANVGICGIQLLDERGQISRSCARFPTTVTFLIKILGLNKTLPFAFKNHAMSEWDHQDSRKVDQVIGAFFMVRKKLFISLDGFDERFFVYFEEVDFTFRARKAGWTSYYLTEAQAFHRGGGTSEQVKGRRLFYSLHSRLQYAYKHYSLSDAALLVVATLLLEPISRIAFQLTRGSLKGIREIMEGFSLLWPVALRMLVNAGKY